MSKLGKTQVCILKLILWLVWANYYKIEDELWKSSTIHLLLIAPIYVNGDWWSNMKSEWPKQSYKIPTVIDKNKNIARFIVFSSAGNPRPSPWKVTQISARRFLIGCERGPFTNFCLQDDQGAWCIMMLIKNKGRNCVSILINSDMQYIVCFIVSWLKHFSR